MSTLASAVKGRARTDRRFGARRAVLVVLIGFAVPSLLQLGWWVADESSSVGGGDGDGEGLVHLEFPADAVD